MSPLSAARRACVQGCNAISVVLVAAIALVVGAHVFWRYVLNAPLGWSDELSRYLMVWLAFLAAPPVLDAKGFTAVEDLQNFLGQRGRRALRLVVWSFIVAVLICLVWQGGLLAWQARSQVASSMPMSIAWVYGAVPLGSVAMLVVAFDQIVRELTGVAAPTGDREGLTAP